MLRPGAERLGDAGLDPVMGSVTAIDPAPELFATHAYAAAKGAIDALMTTMAAAYAPTGSGSTRRARS